MGRALLVALLALALPVQAEVYTYLDKDGNRVFTDRPHAGNAQRLEMAPSNAMSPVAPQPQQRVPPPVLPPSYSLLRIIVPEPDAMVNNGTGDVIVTATSEPGLMAGHSFRLQLDGKPAGEGRSPVFPLTNLDRGTHTLAVEILDAKGRILERTPSQPLHVQRMSLSQKKRMFPCKTEDYGVREECPLKEKPPVQTDIPFVPFI
ncbi:DUF4124 domain-containing protein [Pseudomonas mangiferae]|uniref:DUF4124 domain-containing protein n=1 Tax=Pseudomonas mangiferae TaxID=2593654 RepID=A0A553GYT5_9PSED|nr:DUF4124 domain-containing protein [Pseudomonas mangiferae]TRX74653.1 DUF4124 domain-containing protein [Pseudomonas mangiferae]